MNDSLENFSANDIGFSLASFRAAHPEIAKDPFSKLWVTNGAQKFHKFCLKNIGPYEDLVHALRNRFFLDQMEKFFATETEAVYVNLGAGISSYPLLLPENVVCIEIDRKEIISLKSKRYTEWMNSGLVPKRKIDFFEFDLNDVDQIHNLGVLLKEKIGNQKSFFLMEGLLYFLSQNAVKELFEMISSTQSSGSMIGSVSLEPAIKDSKAYQRMENLFHANLSKKDSEFTFLSTDSYKKKPLYSLLKATNFVELIKEYNLSNLVEHNDNDHIVVESLYLLEKK